MRWLVLTAGLAACTDGFVDTSDTGGGPSVCPEGMSRTTNAEAQATSVNIDGLTWVIGLDPTSLRGEATACVSADLTRSRLILDAAGESFCVVSMTTPTTGEQDLNGTAATLELDFVGAPEPFVVRNGDWVTGTWTVSSLSPAQTVLLQGEARPTGHVLQINLTTAVRR